MVKLESKHVFLSPSVYGSSRTHLKELANTSLLVSLHHSCYQSANLEVFDISQKGSPRKVYAFEEVLGSILLILFSSKMKHWLSAIGHGDVTFNPRRNILGAICVGGEVTYHLFKVNSHSSKNDDAAVELYRKSKWHPEYHTFKSHIAFSSIFMNLDLLFLM